MPNLAHICLGTKFTCDVLLTKVVAVTLTLNKQGLSKGGCFNVKGVEYNRIFIEAHEFLKTVWMFNKAEEITRQVKLRSSTADAWLHFSQEQCN